MRRGQPLATLENGHLVAAVRRAEVEVKRLRRIERDLEQRGGPQHERAVAAREEAWMKAAQIRRQFFDSIIRSPFNGVVEALGIDAGDEIHEGTVTFVVVQTDPLKARLDLAPQKAAELYAGQKIDAAAGSETFRGPHRPDRRLDRRSRHPQQRRPPPPRYAAATHHFVTRETLWHQ